jgi:hypothetical protein
MMSEAFVCGYCRDEFVGEPVRRGEKVYCCEACAFEAARSVDCGGRGDSTVSQPVVEQVEET